MFCLTRASQYDEAQFAYSNGKLVLNPWSNTRPWAEHNQWYIKKPYDFWDLTTWFSTNDWQQQYLLKSLQSRINFVIGAKSNGGDIMVDSNEEYNSLLRGFPLSQRNLDEKFDTMMYDIAFDKFIEELKLGQVGPQREPRLNDFCR